MYNFTRSKTITTQMQYTVSQNVKILSTKNALIIKSSSFNTHPDNSPCNEHHRKIPLYIEKSDVHGDIHYFSYFV